MKKSSLILKYFQKKDQLTVENREYQKTISTLFKWFIDNDKVNDDKTTKYFPNLSSKAKIIAKQEGILSGIEEIEFLLKRFTPLFFKPQFRDGSQFKNGEVIAEISGKSHEILGYERTILNILQRMSGIASETNRIINLIHSSRHNNLRTYFVTNTRDRLYLSSKVDTLPFIAATRKTPWMSLDKKAVAAGGGLTHRLSLSDGILVKDNHLTFISIEEVLKLLTNKYQNDLIEIEVTNEKQASDVIKIFQTLITCLAGRRAHNLPRRQAGHLAIMFDNFTPLLAKQTLSNLQKEFALSKIIFEASGGIDRNNILEWSKTGVDIISLGSLTHSTKAANLSLEIV